MGKDHELGQGHEPWHLRPGGGGDHHSLEVRVGVPPPPEDLGGDRPPGRRRRGVDVKPRPDVTKKKALFFSRRWGLPYPITFL